MPSFGWCKGQVRCLSLPSLELPLDRTGVHHRQSSELPSLSLRTLLAIHRLNLNPPPPSLLPRGVLVSNRTLSPVTFSLHITPSHPSDPRVFHFGKHRSGEHTIIHVPAMGSKEVILRP